MTCQLKILVGSRAGQTVAPQQFPFRVGRNASCGLVLPEPGVWDEHFQIDQVAGRGFIAKAAPNAVLRVDTQPVLESRLRNWAVIECGSVTIQFQVIHGSQKATEWFSAIAVALMLLVFLTEIAMVIQFTR